MIADPTPLVELTEGSCKALAQEIADAMGWGHRDDLIRLLDLSLLARIGPAVTEVLGLIRTAIENHECH